MSDGYAAVMPPMHAVSIASVPSHPSRMLARLLAGHGVDGMGMGWDGMDGWMGWMGLQNADSVLLAVHQRPCSSLPVMGDGALHRTI